MHRVLIPGWNDESESDSSLDPQFTDGGPRVRPFPRLKRERRDRIGNDTTTTPDPSWGPRTLYGGGGTTAVPTHPSCLSVVFTFPWGLRTPYERTGREGVRLRQKTYYFYARNSVGNSVLCRHLFVTEGSNRLDPNSDTV